MDITLFNLLNKARKCPSEFLDLFDFVGFDQNKVLIGSEQWESEMTQENLTALKALLTTELPGFTLGQFSNSPIVLNYPIGYPMLLVAGALYLTYNSFLDPCMQEISIGIYSTEEQLEIQISLQNLSATIRANSFSQSKVQKKMTRTQKPAYEIVGNPVRYKAFKRLMLEGNEWVNVLAKEFGPFTGYELNEFMGWFKKAEREIPKKKKIPVAKEPKQPVLSEKIQVNEGGIDPSGTVSIAKQKTFQKSQGIIEATTNSFCQTESESIKFTFKAKQRYNDLKEVLQVTKGNISENFITGLPEKECEEIAKEIPISVPEKYEAFLLEEVLSAPTFTLPEVKEKPQFITNFNLPDILRIKTETATKLLKTESNLITEPYVHKFREDFDPAEANKPEFILRLPKPVLAKAVMISEPMEKIIAQKKQEFQKKEAEEKKKRTELYGKTREEWVSSFKPLSSLYEMGTGAPHKLLPTEEYLESYKIQARKS